MNSPLRPLVPLALLASLPAAQQVLHDVSGSTADSYGQVCDIVGDTDGDGRAEFLVGAWRDDPGGLPDAGTVFVYDGATGVPTAPFLGGIPGSGDGDHMGFGSSAAGDLNGDGFADICAAADEDDVPGVGNNAGSARMVSGFDGSTLFTATGDSGSDLFGWSSAAVGDVDGDGFDDVLVGALLDEGGGSPNNAGSITVLSGATGAVIHTIYGSGGGMLGAAVGRAGDVNGDGRADLIASQGALARVFSGLDGSQLFQVPAPSGNISVSGGIDANGDGFDDVVIGAPGAAGNRGQVVILAGPAGGVLQSFLGDIAGDQLGAGVAGAGDLDGDGYGDVVAGAPGADLNGNQSGLLRAYSGRTGAVIGTVAGGGANHCIGQSVGSGGDVDGDGFFDAIGCGTCAARARVVSFTPTGLAPFGTGTPGCDGTQPLLANGVPSVGNAGLELHSSNGAPLAPATLLISDGPDPLGLPIAGALLHVVGPGTTFLLVQATPPADAIGSLVVPFPLPANPNLAGQTLALQLASIWAGPCPTVLSTTRGLAMTIQ